MSKILSFIKNNKKLVITILALLLVAGATTVILVTTLSPDDPGNNGGTVNLPGFTPDYPAPPVDSGAEDVEDNEEKLDAPEGGGAVGLIYSNEVEIDLSDNKATILFANPNRSTHNVTVDLVIQGQVVAKSGLLTPSKRLTSLTLEDGIAAQLPDGVYKDAKFLVRFYDPVSNECSIVNSEIVVTVTARD